MILTEHEQRKVYEWFYPELKGKEWRLRSLHRNEPKTVAAWGKKPNDGWDGSTHIQTLYLPSGTPNYQFFFTGVVPKIEATNMVHVEFRSETRMTRLYHYKHGEGWTPVEVTDGRDSDPYRAVFEYIEEVESNVR